MVPRTAGILGSGPNHGTRVTNLERGEREVGGDSESEYRRPSSPPHLPDRMVDVNMNPSATHPRVLHEPKFPNLRKLVGHLWRGAPARSFVAAVRSESAPVVRVTMNCGSGQRSNFGYSRESFRARQ